jgi:uncharacterized protein (DUF4415 family)
MEHNRNIVKGYFRGWEFILIPLSTVIPNARLIAGDLEPRSIVAAQAGFHVSPSAFANAKARFAWNDSFYPSRHWTFPSSFATTYEHRAGIAKHMSKVTSDQLTPKQRKMLAKIATVKDDDIDFSDIPEQLDWKDAKRGVFYKPVKQQLTLRLDADVVD